MDDEDMTMLADLKAILSDARDDDDIIVHRPPRIRVFGGTVEEINELIERIVDRFDDGTCIDKASIRDVLTEVFFEDAD